MYCLPNVSFAKMSLAITGEVCQQTQPTCSYEAFLEQKRKIRSAFGCSFWMQSINFTTCNSANCTGVPLLELVTD
jgi:hypothetical protein